MNFLGVVVFQMHLSGFLGVVAFEIPPSLIVLFGMLWQHCGTSRMDPRGPG